MAEMTTEHNYTHYHRLLAMTVLSFVSMYAFSSQEAEIDQMRTILTQLDR